jgi:saccharopine dehydrogenase-like NADP-dependent oxidoreductase
VDCGVSPGLSNFAVGRAAAALASIDDVRILVGGLPVDRTRPFGYAILFSATDVIEEYTRPARIVEEGRVVTRPALSEVEAVEVAGIGTLEAFLTDGLRTLLTTVKARSMVEKTLRYPGHAAAMHTFSQCGFFGAEPVEAGGVSVAPRTVTERLLSRAWKLETGEEEFTFLRIVVLGRDVGGVSRRLTFELLDRTDPATGTTSMARTTGFPCAVMVAMLARGEYRDPGVRPLEFLAKDPGSSLRFLEMLRARGLQFEEVWEESRPSGPRIESSV